MNEQEKLPVLVFKLPTKEMSSNSFSLGNIAHNKESKRKIPRNKSSPKTIKPLIPLEHCIQITLDKNVILLVVKDTKYDYSSIKTFEDVIKLDKDFPELIVGFNPPLFKDFISEDNKIVPYTFINDVVKRKFTYGGKKTDVPKKVIDLRFVSLSNMTVIVAVLEDKDICVTNSIQSCT